MDFTGKGLVLIRFLTGSLSYQMTLWKWFWRCGWQQIAFNAMVMALMLSSATAQSKNPITSVARMSNSDLVMMEDRLVWLEERIRTMAVFHEHSLRAGIGARGYRALPDDPDPEVLIDLGEVYEIDRIYLVPSQRESLDDKGMFPRLFSIAGSVDAEFSEPILIFSTGGVEFPDPQGRPIPFSAFKIPVRYIRMTVHRGHGNKGWLDTFGLSEIIVTSETDVISFGAEVRITSSLDSGRNWYPGALTDGRMPHGIWHSGISHDDRGDQVVVAKDHDGVSWDIDLGEPHKIDRLVLFPYKLTASMESMALANRLSVHVRKHGDSDWEEVIFWQNTPESASCVNPVVIPLGGIDASQVRVQGEHPWLLGDLSVFALSEIEIWSGGENIAIERPVFRLDENGWVEVRSLTNGFTSEHMIAKLDVWLQQLHDRLQFERELDELRPRIRIEQADSELNVTFASAILLSLTFMIPVLLYEKRRIKAKQRLDILRKRIAADLHDDVGGNLGSISLIARSARRGLEKIPVPVDFTNDLHEVELIARESSLAMRDIVWLIEQHDDSVGDLVARMRETGARMLRDLDYALSCESERASARMSLDFKRHFFLFFKEALHNILKHSQAKRVSILLNDDGDDIALEIQDDGVGMSREMVDNPNTSRKLRQRAEVLGGELTITSAEGKGTLIRLTIPAKKLTAVFTTT